MSRPRTLVLRLALTAAVAVCPAAAAAQGPAGFDKPAPRDLVLPVFSDDDVETLLATLDGALAGRQTVPAADEASHTLWTFAKRLQAGRLTASQETRVLDHLRGIARGNPEYQGPVERARFMVSALTIGKVAPDAIGQDLLGGAFKLSDYRGKVVVLTFSADWCAICRTQFPYYRLMQELYANWPFAILGVEAGSREQVSRLKSQHGLTYRSWWDAPAGADRGPIAEAWNVLGWPTTYVLDAQGVIRFVDLRDEDLLKGVRQLLNEHVEHATDRTGRQRH